MNREAYFLDKGLIGFLKHIECLCVITNKDLFRFIQDEIANNKELQGMKFCKEKTFYEWLRIGKRESLNRKQTKKALLYQETYRLKNSMRKENQSRIFDKKLNKMTLPKIVSYTYHQDKIKKLKIELSNKEKKLKIA